VFEGEFEMRNLNRMTVTRVVGGALTAGAAIIALAAPASAGEPSQPCDQNSFGQIMVDTPAHGQWVCQRGDGHPNFNYTWIFQSLG
jgi:hypothetical protein